MELLPRNKGVVFGQLPFVLFTIIPLVIPNLIGNPENICWIPAFAGLKMEKFYLRYKPNCLTFEGISTG